MFWSLVSLLLLAAALRVIYSLIRAFFAWLGRGKPIERAAVNRDLPEDVRKAAAGLDYYYRLKGYRAEIGKPTRLTRAQLKVIARAERLVRNDRVNHMMIGWYQLVILFLVGSVAGLALEEVWMFITTGLTEGRYGLVWGPFSPLYGVGCALLTIISLKLRRRNATWWQTFLAAMIVGGLLEQITGWGMETLMGAVSWDYSAVPGAITKWVAVPFLLFWGILGLIWADVVTPWLLDLIGEPTTRRQVVFVLILAVYLGLDVFMTTACFARRAARDHGIPPANGFEVWIDTHYSNEFMSNRFENMVIEGED